MSHSALSGLPMIEEVDADPKVAAIYDEVKRTMGVPFVPNLFKALAASPAALKTVVGIYGTFFANTILPQSLIAMVVYTIATKNECMYCSANNELTCRTLGVDEQTLADLINDLSNINPERVAAIIEFTTKVARTPKAVVAEDYDRVRDHGLSDEEITELIVLAGIAIFSDTLADGLKIEVDSMVMEALGR
jgi:uncharacterized peroxidase-related enzyme